MHEANVVARHLNICGRVQGVSYRASAQFEAERLGLTGWVRNRRDGSVEAVVVGHATLVEEFIAWARRGPAAAVVLAVEVEATDVPPITTFTLEKTV